LEIMQGADIKKQPLLTYVSVQNKQRRNFRLAIFKGCILLNTNFRHAQFQGANLKEANLQGASLWRANLQGAI
ncbi:MAG: pentapeptide repeat-containing protein, partial [Methylococcales bacterium]|nr:pentapeptide repeat-containing protein [Methylococcales bacterium]